MADDLNKQRSRRALLAAAAGGAAALAANAVVPLTAAAANGDPITLGGANVATATTSIENTTSGSATFLATAVGTGFGLKGSSAGSAGVYGVSTDDTLAAAATTTTFTGVYGWSPTSGETGFGTGVWGDSEDVGTYGTGFVGVRGDGTYGVIGFGTIGVYGASESSTNPGVRAEGSSATGLALHALGKVKFSRSGRKSMSSGKSSVVVTLAGTTSTSKVFAVLATSESGRYVRAVVPASGKFTVYLNTTLRSSAVVSWFVLD